MAKKSRTSASKQKTQGFKIEHVGSKSGKSKKVSGRATSKGKQTSGAKKLKSYSKKGAF